MFIGQEGSPVPPERIERKLAAILAADVAGYSRLMGADEESTLARLKACRRELIDPKIAEHRGRVVKTTGDGVLAEFVSAVIGLASLATGEVALASVKLPLLAASIVGVSVFVAARQSLGIPIVWFRLAARGKESVGAQDSRRV